VNVFIDPIFLMENFAKRRT